MKVVVAIDSFKGSLSSLEAGEAIREGVKNVVIMAGRVPHSILMELLTDEGAGTLVTNNL